MIIGSTPIFIFDNHNMALPVWGTFAVQYGPLNLVTFDTHTDTFCPFMKFMAPEKTSYDPQKVVEIPKVKELLSTMRLQINNFSFEDAFRYSFGIYNTEQILTGVVLGYLKSYTIRCRHNDLASYEENDRFYGYDATYIGEEDLEIPAVIEPLFLDFDLDFFRERTELDDEFVEYIRPYLIAAKGITIAKEPRYFNDGRFDGTFSNDEAEELLIRTIRKVLEPSC